MKKESINNHFIACCICILSKYRAGDIFGHDQRIFSGFDIKLHQCSGDVKSTNKQARQ